MTTVRAHIKGKALKDIRTKVHDELRLNLLEEAFKRAVEDDLFRQECLREWPELGNIEAWGQQGYI